MLPCPGLSFFLPSPRPGPQMISAYRRHLGTECAFVGRRPPPSASVQHQSTVPFERAVRQYPARRTQALATPRFFTVFATRCAAAGATVAPPRLSAQARCARPPSLRRRRRRAHNGRTRPVVGGERGAIRITDFHALEKAVQFIKVLGEHGIGGYFNNVSICFINEMRSTGR